MAYASVTYTSASGTTFALTNSSGDPIPYLRQSDISVTVNNVLKTLTTDYTFNTAGTSIVLNTAVSGVSVVIARVTDIADATVTYTAGSTLTAQDLNNADNQIRYGLQEFSDTYGALTTGTGDLSALAGFIGSAETWTSDNAHTATTGAIDNRVDSKISTNNATVVLRDGSQAMQAALSLGGFKVTNLATPTSNTDASTKAYVDSNVGSVSASATAAAASASAAATSASNASTSASAASASQSAAASSASSASTSASNASTSASSASTSASNASTSATNASTSATSAASSAASALAAFDSFDDRYLGSKASDPTVDNDGDPLNAGDIYFNTTLSIMRVYTGTAWVAAYVPGDAVNISFTPYSTIAATNVQNAVQELTDEKLNLTGGTLTGALVNPLGSAAAPSLTFTGDTNTGVYSPGADQVAISTNGTGRLFVDAGGRVGVGDTDPSTATYSTRLSVVGNTTSGNPLSQANASAIRIQCNAYPESTTGAFYLMHDGGGDGSIVSTRSVGNLKFATANTERMRLDSSGRLGVGNSSPLSLIHIGTTHAATDVPVPTGNFFLIRGGGYNNTTTAGIQLSSGYGDSGRIGAFNIKTIGAGSGSSFTTDLAISTQGSFSGAEVERLRIDSSGRVGIGTSAPADKCSIAGSSATDFRALTLRNSNGTNGSTAVLTFEASSGAEGENGAIAAQIKGVREGAGTSGALSFWTSTATPTEKVRIDSSGRVGIGTSTFSDARESLIVAPASGQASTFSIIKTGSTNAESSLFFGDTDSNYSGGISYEHSTDALVFRTNGSQKCRLTNDGKFLVGTSSAPSSFDAQYAKLTVCGNTVSAAGDSYFNITRGTAAGSIANSSPIGSIFFTESSGGTYAQIQALCDGTGGANDYPGRLIFATTADGASSPTERMRIGSDGNVAIGTTSNPSSQRLRVTGGSPAFEVSDATVTTATTGYIGFQVRADIGAVNISSSGSNAIAFFKSGNASGLNGATVGTISVTTSATAYNTSSDYRLKENIEPITGATDRILQLSPSRFNFIVDPDKIVDGFIAHEAQAVVPECVTGAKDAVDDEGNPIYQGIDQSKLVPLLTAALQEAIAEIKALKDRVTALESA
jgi:hypothetical protein